MSKTFGFDRGTPIDRYYIEFFLKTHAADIRGAVLEMGEDTYTRKYAGTAVDSRIFSFGESQGQNYVTGDLSRHESLAEEIADCFICTQTFNFIYDISAAVAGARKLLRPGGVLLATVACMAPVSAYDAERWGDYWRLTPQGCERLFGGVFNQKIQVTPFGNSAVAALFMKGYALQDLPSGFDLSFTDPLFPVVIGIRAVK